MLSPKGLIALHRFMTEKGREIMVRKNADYGANVDPFANFRMSSLVGVDNAKGILVRILDKIARVVSFIDKGMLQVKDESVEDSIIDAINYFVLLRGILLNETQAEEINTAPTPPTQADIINTPINSAPWKDGGSAVQELLRRYPNLKYDSAMQALLTDEKALNEQAKGIAKSIDNDITKKLYEDYRARREVKKNTFNKTPLPALREIIKGLSTDGFSFDGHVPWEGSAHYRNLLRWADLLEGQGESIANNYRTITQLQKEAYEQANRRKAFEHTDIDGFTLAWLHAELSEAFEELKAGRLAVYYTANEHPEEMKPEGFFVELSDCVVGIMSLFEHHKVNLQKVIELKMDYNKTRPMLDKE